MTALPFDRQTLEAFADACLAMATLQEAGLWDPDMHEPPVGWRRQAQLLRCAAEGDTLTVPGVGHGDQFVVLDLHSFDPKQFPEEFTIVQLDLAHARLLARGLYAAADRAAGLPAGPKGDHP